VQTSEIEVKWRLLSGSAPDRLVCLKWVVSNDSSKIRDGQVERRQRFEVLSVLRDDGKARRQRPSP
jgi:hypothetical protein